MVDLTKVIPAPKELVDRMKRLRAEVQPTLQEVIAQMKATARISKQLNKGS